MKLIAALRIVLLVQTGVLIIWYFTRCSQSKRSAGRSMRMGLGLGPGKPSSRNHALCKALEDKSVEEITATEISSCHQLEPLLLIYIKERHVIPPSKLPYTFMPQPQPPGDILETLWPLLEAQTRGQERKIYVEAGASDGISGSNSIWLEETKNWTGVLIECHPEAVPTLLERNRKAYIVNMCLSKTEYPTQATLTSVDGWHYSSSLGNGSIFPDFAQTFTKYEVQTMPLYAILAALDVTTVDFFSLDIQSQEPYVLRTFPFDLIHVKVWIIEINLITPEEKADLIQLMISKGYVRSTMFQKGESDLVFIHKKRRGDRKGKDREEKREKLKPNFSDLEK